MSAPRTPQQRMQDTLLRLQQDVDAWVATSSAFAAKTGFDPRRYSEPYLYFRVHPQRVQAWRAVNEHDGRELMRDGRRVVP